MAREQGRKLIAQNRKARHDYLIDATFEAGWTWTLSLPFATQSFTAGT